MEGWKAIAFFVLGFGVLSFAFVERAAQYERFEIIWVLSTSFIELLLICGLASITIRSSICQCLVYNERKKKAGVSSVVSCV